MLTFYFNIHEQTIFVFSIPCVSKVPLQFLYYMYFNAALVLQSSQYRTSFVGKLVCSSCVLFNFLNSTATVFVLLIINSVSTNAATKVNVVVQFYPWFNFYIPLFFSM